MVKRIRIKPPNSSRTLPALRGQFTLTGQNIAFGGGAAPVWSSTPSYNLTAGVAAGPYTLPVSSPSGGSITVSWHSSSIPSSKPSWITLTSGITPTITFSGAQTDTDDVTSLVLTATNATGTVNSSSGTITVSPVAQSSGLWGTSYSYSAPIWTLTNRAGTGIAAPATSNNQAQFIGSLLQSKHTQSFYRSDGRVWHGVGDAGGFARSNVDGYDDINAGSNQPAIYSFNPSSPTTVRREVGSYPTFNSTNYNTIWCCADEGFMVYDETADSAWIKPLRSDGYDQFPSSDEAEVPSFVSANVIRFSGDQRTKYAANKALIVYINYQGTIPNVPKRARIASSNLNGANTDVTLTWFDSSPTMSVTSPPTGVRKQNESSSRVGGGWESSEIYALPRFNETTGKWQNTLCKLNLSTRVMTEVQFECANKPYGLLNPKNAIFVPASKTGTGHAEIHCFGNDGNNACVMVYDLTTFTFVVYPITTSTNNDSMAQPQACFDGERYAYVPQWVEGRIMKWDCRNKAEVWAKAVTIGGKYLFNINAEIDPETACPGSGISLYGEPVFAPIQLYTPSACMLAHTAPFQRPIFIKDLLQTVWNAEINRIELYRIMEGFGDIFLIDPSKSTLTDTSGAVEYIGNTDGNGQAINGGWNVQHIPTTGNTPASTVLMGGLTFDTNRATDPDKLRFFIGANKRQWQELTNGQHYHRNMANTSGNSQNAATADSSSNQPYLANYGLFPIWGSIIPSVAAGTGIPNGTAFVRGGGDGDYTGNEVLQIHLDQISGTTVPMTTFLATNTSTIAQWKNRPRMTPKIGGGTTAQSEIFVNPADLTQWQPPAIHGYRRVGYHPSVGYIEDHVGPDSTPVPTSCPDDGLFYSSWSGRSDPTYMSPESRCMYSQVNGQILTIPANTSRRIISWNPTGVNAGLWRSQAAGPVEGGDTNWHSQCISEYNASNGYTLHCWQSANVMRVHRWDGSGSITKVVNVTGSGGDSLIGDHGNQTGQIFWLESNNYLILSDRRGERQLHYWTYPNTTAQKLSGSQGNPLLDTAIYTDNKGISIAVDRENRRVIWLIPIPNVAGSGVLGNGAYYWPIELYQSSFDNLMSLKKMYVFNDGELRYFHPDENNAGSTLSFVYNGYLYCASPGSNNPSSSGHVGLALTRIPLY